MCLLILPSLVEGRSDEVLESGGLDVATLLQLVQISLELHPGVAAHKELLG